MVGDIFRVEEGRELVGLTFRAEEGRDQLLLGRTHLSN